MVWWGRATPPRPVLGRSPADGRPRCATPRGAGRVRRAPPQGFPARRSLRRHDSPQIRRSFPRILSYERSHVSYRMNAGLFLVSVLSRKQDGQAILVFSELLPSTSRKKGKGDENAEVETRPYFDPALVASNRSIWQKSTRCSII